LDVFQGFNIFNCQFFLFCTDSEDLNDKAIECVESRGSQLGQEPQLFEGMGFFDYFTHSVYQGEGLGIRNCPLIRGRGRAGAKWG
jgi:hypothetical protein